MKSTNKTVQMALNSVACNGGTDYYITYKDGTKEHFHGYGTEALRRKCKGEAVRAHGGIARIEDEYDNEVPVPNGMGADEVVKWTAERKGEIRKMLMQVNLVAGQCKGVAQKMVGLAGNLSGPAGAAAEKWARDVAALCETVESGTARVLR